MEKKIKLLSYLLSSSDSDSEEEYSHLCERKTLPKITEFLNVINSFDNNQFRKYFRMRRETADLLIEKFQSSVYFPKKDGHGGRVPICAATHIYSFLWFAGNKATIKDVSQRFGMSESSMHRIITERMLPFLLELGQSVIKMPTKNTEKVQLEEEFKKISGFPGVLGCIDGTSIPIRTPSGKIKSTYVNRHDTPSICLQAICDSKKKFIDIFTGVPGKIHDARVFKMSDIYTQLPNICGTKYHVLGDGAYPIRPWLLVPYKNYGKLSREQCTYNKKFSATRVFIENSFGILKSRFRQLLKLEMLSVVTMTKFIISCCILHNFCIDSGDVFEESHVVSEENEVEEYGETEWRLKKQGEQKRDSIKNIFQYT